ncbi:MAG: hypothetical protein JXB88_09155 [Spirochaetales bacterium]|nr:hypothetical protein [Spirochaetales bacterium]
MKIKYNQNICVGVTLFLLMLIGNSCTDIINYAWGKGTGFSICDDLIVIDFIASRGINNREVVLTWKNPTDRNFYKVRLLRKVDAYPTGPRNSEATVLYYGTNEKYTDSGLTPDTSYYYAIYSENTSHDYSAGNYTNRTINETEVDIRKRSFFLVGGSSNKAAPTTNLVSGVDMFDPLEETLYSAVTTLPNPRVFCDIASVDNKIYVFGGKDDSDLVDIVDVLDVENLTWTETTDPMPAAKCGLKVFTWNNKIYCMGGSTATDATGANTADALNTYIYLPVSDAWLTQDDNLFRDVNGARCTFDAVVYNGMIYYYGGVDQAGTYQRNGYYINILTNQEGTTIGTGFSNTYMLGASASLYHKELDNGEEVIFYLRMGGSGDPAETGLPAVNIANLENYNQAYVCFIPNLNGGTPAGYSVYPKDGPNTGIENFTNRMYAGCDYYGDYIYIFGGITAGGGVDTGILKLDVKDGALTYASWSVLTTSLGTARYGFGITKVTE